MKKLFCTIGVIVSLFYVVNALAIEQTKNIFDITTRAFGRTLDFTSDTVTSTRDKFKVVNLAKPDAAVYVASDGKIQGAYLTKAFDIIRESYPELSNLSDLQLAQAVLAVQ